MPLHGHKHTVSPDDIVILAELAFVGGGRALHEQHTQLRAAMLLTTVTYAVGVLQWMAFFDADEVSWCSCMTTKLS